MAPSRFFSSVLRSSARPAGHDGPRLTDARSLAGALPPLLVEAERVAATVTPGLHGRRRAGVGETFWQYRRYEPGDRPQSIDWRRSARADPVFVREREWEAAQTVWLWVDSSASMDYASAAAHPAKGARAALLALALAVLLERAGERFALLDPAAHRACPPSAGAAGLQRLATALGQPPGETVPAAGRGGSAVDLAVARHGQVALFGDFLAPLDETAARVRALAGRGVRGVMVQVLDPAEVLFPFQGRVRFDGPEPGDDSVLLDRAEDLRSRYVARLRDHGAGLAALARMAGWRLLVHQTDHPPAMALMALHQGLAGLRGGRGSC